jgi:hypothetical protein
MQQPDIEINLDGNKVGRPSDKDLELLSFFLFPFKNKTHCGKFRDKHVETYIGKLKLKELEV